MVAAPNREEATRIANALVSKELAACVQALDISSTYIWKGSVQHDPEVLLLIKTLSSLFSQVQDVVRAEHSYEVPEILQLDVSAGDADYLLWMQHVTRGP